jgi:hypothetical protein
MNRFFNFKSYKLAQALNIDEETGEIIEDEPKVPDFNAEFAHEKDTIDLGNEEDLEYLRSIGSPLPDMIASYLVKPDSAKEYGRMPFGSKLLLIPPKLGLQRFISDNKLAKFAFMTTDQVLSNDQRARKYFQNITLSHTPRPKSATVNLRYSTETGSGKGSDVERRIAIIPKLTQYISDPDQIEYDPLLRLKDSHELGFKIDILRAIFDDNYFKEAYAKELIDRDDVKMIKYKQKILRELKAEVKKDPSRLPPLRKIAIQMLKGTERKFEYDKVHSVKLDKSGSSWYPGDIEALIKRAIM